MAVRYILIILTAFLLVFSLLSKRSENFTDIISHELNKFNFCVKINYYPTEEYHDKSDIIDYTKTINPGGCGLTIMQARKLSIDNKAGGFIIVSSAGTKTDSVGETSNAYFTLFFEKDTTLYRLNTTHLPTGSSTSAALTLNDYVYPLPTMEYASDDDEVEEDADEDGGGGNMVVRSVAYIMTKGDCGRTLTYSPFQASQIANHVDNSSGSASPLFNENTDGFPRKNDPNLGLNIKDVQCETLFSSNDCFITEAQAKKIELNLTGFPEKDRAYYVDGKTNLWKEKRDRCCHRTGSMPTEEIDDMTPLKVRFSRSSYCDPNNFDRFFQKGCDSKCRRVKPSFDVYRKDLSACIPRDKKCSSPTYEACKSKQFRRDCGNVCGNDCKVCGKDGYIYYENLGSLLHQDNQGTPLAARDTKNGVKANNNTTGEVYQGLTVDLEGIIKNYSEKIGTLLSYDETLHILTINPDSANIQHRLSLQI
jgi:hypothetical protein